MEEFGRTPRCVCNVLAVLGEDDVSTAATVAAAVELAHASNARLTLVKTCEPGRAFVWIAPFAVGAAYLPPELECPDEAARALSRIVDRVPASIPVTKLVLIEETQVALLKLLRQGHFGAVVADSRLLSRCRRLRRLLRREQLYTVVVDCDDKQERAIPAPTQAASKGAIGAGPWPARRLAGAEGER